MLQPLVHDGMRITLKRFVLKKNNLNNKNSPIKNTDGMKKDEIGAVFILSSNNFTSIFFTAYGLLICTIIIYILSSRTNHKSSK